MNEEEFIQSQEQQARPQGQPVQTFAAGRQATVSSFGAGSPGQFQGRDRSHHQLRTDQGNGETIFPAKIQVPVQERHYARQNAGLQQGEQQCARQQEANQPVRSVYRANAPQQEQTNNQLRQDGDSQ